jgi:murein DD-endopeptidase MepM/ murein hydrolase activator NlpD
MMKTNGPLTTDNGHYLLLAILLTLLLSPAGAYSLSTVDITVTPSTIGQGDVALVTVRQRAVRPQITWMEKKITVAYNEKNELWAGFIGADLTTDPGRYRLQISYANNAQPDFIPITVRSKDHGIRRITVPKEMVELDRDTLQRVLREISTVKQVFMRSSEDPLWWGRWTRPLPGTVVSPFGCRNIVNGMERSPHSGVDLKAPAGSPVKATNRGIVALVAEHFFSGKSIVIDHGGGIFSMYFHLSHISVGVGELVEKGELIGLSGCSGRVTGPHLHFGIRLNGRRINPLTLIQISKTLE